MKHTQGYFAKHSELAPKIKLLKRSEHKRQPITKLEAVTLRRLRLLKESLHVEK